MELVDFASMLVVGAVLAAFGQGITQMIYGNGSKAGHPGWKGVFYVTLWLHPILVGALLGLTPWLPSPEFMGDAWLGRVMWYALAGVFSSTAYDAIKNVLKHQSASKARRSEPPKDENADE